MQEAFEKNIGEQLKSFKLQPSESVWQEVEAALHQKKRRVAPFWWMTFIGIVVLSSLMLLKYFNNQQTNNQEFVNNTIDNKQAKENLTPLAQHENSVQKNKNVKEEIEAVKENNQQQIKQTNENVLEKYNTKSIRKDASTSQKLQASIYAVKEENSKAIISNNKTENEQITNSIDITEQKFYFQKADLLPIESLIKTIFSDKQIAEDHQLQHNIASTNFKKQEAKRKWFITGSAGLLTTTQNGFLDNIATAQDASSFGNSGSLASSARTTNVSYPNGSSYMLGGGFQQTINKKWSYNMALQYKLLSAPLHSIDSLFRFQSSKYRAHWIQIPVNFSYQLNNSNNPFYLTAGLSGAYALASNWSYADLTNNRFLNDNTKNRKLFVNAQIGAVYTVQKNWLIQVSLEKSLTSVHRRVADKFYYTQFNIQIFKFLQTKSKK